MRIIQSLNTFSGEKTNGGFRNKESLLKYLKISYQSHSVLTDDYVFYTDIDGYEIVKDVIHPYHIEIIEFPNELYGKLIYEGKFYVQSLQTEPYIHVDLDATLFSLPPKADVYLEKYRPMIYLGREATILDIEHLGITQIPCSALIGFSDMELQRKYLKEVYKRFEIIRNIPRMSYVYAYTLEEVLLQRLIVDNNKTAYSCDCSHLANRK